MNNENWEISREYGLPFIKNKKLFRAVMFSRRLIREGLNPGLAHYKAAKYYKVPMKEVAHYVGIAAANIVKFRNGEID